MKLLVLSSRIPWPIEKGDKLRLYYQLKELSKHHEIVLCCLSENDMSESAMQALQPFCNRIVILKLHRFIRWFNVALGIISRRPFQVLYFFQRKASRQLRYIIDEEKLTYLLSTHPLR